MFRFISIFSGTMLPQPCYRILENIEIKGYYSLIRLNLETVATRKQSTPNFSKNDHFLSPDMHTLICLSGCKKCSFFGKFVAFCFLVTTVLRVILLPATNVMLYGMGQARQKIISTRWSESI